MERIEKELPEAQREPARRFASSALTEWRR